MASLLSNIRSELSDKFDRNEAVLILEKFAAQLKRGEYEL
jgi:hypothetical protein